GSRSTRRFPEVRMKFKIDRIISIATLIASLAAIVLVLRRPAPLAPRPTPAAIEEHARSFDQKMAQFDQAAQSTPAANTAQPEVTTQPPAQSASSQSAETSSSSNQPPKAEVHINSDEISAVLAQALGTAGAAGLTPDSNIGAAAPAIKDQQVSFDGDLVHGQFLTEIAGKDVWITVSGHIGEKDGYATFDPTEFKVGDLNVPVSLVNPALQKKLAEQRDRLKLPDNVGAMKVENGELVMQQK
ncbi:MAG TPA: hypothetical protein VMD76_04810, partial [Candidatus Sulfotelmatobacter sp.]|nr:hypothetical protein [Candidatus Sulfotelmatobacter sp.]